MPGRVEAEDFDLGGPEVAYSDRDHVNYGSDYRPESVDVEIGPNGDLCVGRIESGEWLSYSLNFMQSIEWTFDLELAHESSRSAIFHIEIDGDDMTGPIEVDNPGIGFAMVRIENLFVPIGDHQVRFVFDRGGLVFNWYSVMPSGDLDLIAPTVPRNVQAAMGQNTAVILSWLASEDDKGVRTYRIYRDGVAVLETNQLEATLTDQRPGAHYDFRVQAEDEEGNASGLSPAVSLRLPF
jgi:hypothetical protein